MAELTCAICDGPMVRVARSRPQGEAVCHPCRRARKEAAAEARRQAAEDRRAEREQLKAERTATRICSKCRLHFTPRTTTQRFCTLDCWYAFSGMAPKPRRRKRNWNRTPHTKSTTERGYGAAHQKERRRWATQVEAGRAWCWRCQLPIGPNEPWDLGHADDDRTQYRGPEHRRCNRKAGAAKANRSPKRRKAGTASTTIQW